jgi:tetratricopeptide (TPR) repeat protein
MKKKGHNQMYRLIKISFVFLTLSGCAAVGQSYENTRGSHSLEGLSAASAMSKSTVQTAAMWTSEARTWIVKGQPSRAEDAVLKALQLGGSESELKPIVAAAAKLSGHRAPPDVMWSFRNEQKITIALFWSVRGRHLFKGKKYAAAIADLTRALTLRSINSIDWAFLARSHGEMKHPIKAAEAGTKALEQVISEGSLTHSKRWAMLQFIVAQAQRAHRPDLIADGGMIWLTQAGSPTLVPFLKSVKWPANVRTMMLRRGLKATPGDNAVRLELGQHLFAKQKYLDARDVLIKMPRRTPRWRHAFEIGAEAAHRADDHGTAVWMHGQLKDQRRWSRRRSSGKTQLNPYRVVNALMRGKRFAWARSEAFVDLATRPTDTKLLYLYALATAISVNERAGYDAMLKVLLVDPKHVAALNFVGYSLVVWNEDLSRAETLLSQALNAEPNNPSILDSMGWLHYRKGELNEALRLLKRASAALPSSGTVTFHLACVLRKLGNIEESETLYRQALKLEQDPQERVRFSPEWSSIQ